MLANVLHNAPRSRRVIGALASILVAGSGLRSLAAAPSEEPRGGAETTPAPLISANGFCPAAETISTAVAALIPRGGLAALPRAVQIDVSDLGETYRVSVKTPGNERVRVYRDVPRDCEQRARFVAVFIVLTLMPPELLMDSPLKGVAPPPPPPPDPVPPPVAIVSEPPPRRFRLELGAVLDLAPSVLDAPSSASPGGELRFSTQARRFGGTIALGLQPRADFTAGGLQGRQTRVPFDLGVRALRSTGAFELTAEVGFAGAVFRAEGVNPVRPGSGTRLDLGGRVAVALRFGRSQTRLAPTLGVHGLYFPKPYELGVTPSGVLGHTPSLWVGATFGVSSSF